MTFFPGVRALSVEGWSLYKKNWRLFLRIGVIVWLLNVVGTFAGAMAAMVFATKDVGQQAALRYLLPALITVRDALGMGGFTFFAILLLIGLIFGMLWTIVVLVRAIDRSHGNASAPKYIRDVARGAWSRVPTLLAALVLSGLAVTAGMLLLVIPGVLFLTWFYFVSFIVVLEGANALQSLRESRRMVVGRMWIMLWRVLAVFVLFFIAALVMGWILNAILALVLLPLADTLEQGSRVMLWLLLLVSVLVDAAPALLITPLASCVQYVLYHHAKQPRNAAASCVRPEDLMPARR